MKRSLLAFILLVAIAGFPGCHPSSFPGPDKATISKPAYNSKQQPGKSSIGKADSLFRKAMAYYKRGRYPVARKLLEKTLKIYPNHPMASRMLVSQLGREPLPFALHVIHSGDTLSGLCQKYYGTVVNCELLTNFNKLDQSDKLKPGQVLVLPPQTNSRWPQNYRRSLPEIKGKIEHKIKNGQSLSKIAQIYYGNYTLFHVIASYNGLVDATRVADGRSIVIPQFKEIHFKKSRYSPKHGHKKSHEAISSRNKKLRLALNHYKHKRWKAAIVEFKNILARYPRDETSLDYLPKALFQQARIDYDQGRYLKAGQGFEKALAYDINCNECEHYLEASIEAYKNYHYQRGIKFFQEEQYKKAIDEWEKVYTMDPDYKAVEYNLKHARWKLGPPIANSQSSK